MSEIAIRAEHLSKQYKIGRAQKRHDTLRDALTEGVADLFRKNGQRATGEDTIWALDDVSFEVQRGDVVGVIGRNGAGKSTLLKILSRITKPTRGHAEIHGRVGSLLEVGTGFHGELTGRENIYLNGAILGMKRAEIDRKFDEIVAFAEVEKFIDTPVKRYSSGMYVRLAFAVAAHLEAEILMVDEVLAVGDAAFQKKCLGKMGDVAKEGRTVLFVSHNMDAIRNFCPRALLLSAGQLELQGPGPEVIRRYLGLSERVFKRTLNLKSPVISLDEILLIGANGNPCEFFRYDQGFSIEVRYHVHRSVPGLSIGIIVYAENGQPVFTTTSRAAHGGERLAEGLGLSRVIVPGYFLSPGEFSIFINTHTMHETFFAMENALAFRISDAGREILGREGQMHWPGVVSPLLNWQNIPVNSDNEGN